MSHIKLVLATTQHRMYLLGKHDGCFRKEIGNRSTIQNAIFYTFVVRRDLVFLVDKSLEARRCSARHIFIVVSVQTVTNIGWKE